MVTTDLARESLGSTIEGTGVVLADLWALWCGPCRRFGPISEEASGHHDGVVFDKADAEAEQGLAFALGIQSIPTIVAFRAGVLVFRHSGLLNGTQVNDLVKQVKELDPEKLREKMRERPAD